jgi:hypothetical protein
VWNAGHLTRIGVDSPQYTLGLGRRDSPPPTPETVAFFGYGSSLASDRGLSLSDLRRQSDGFFVKLAYLFRR